MTFSESSVVARGLIKAFDEAKLIGPAGVHIARTLELHTTEHDERVLLASAMCARAAQQGSACLPMNSAKEIEALLVSEDDPDPELAQRRRELPWPDHAEWLNAIRESQLTALDPDDPASGRPLRLDDGRLYLERNWSEQESVCQAIVARLKAAPPRVDGSRLEAALDRYFATTSDEDAARTLPQRQAARQAVTQWTTVIAGGPGTGKTSTVARMLRVLEESSDRPLRIGLAAFSGKAATRLKESLDESVESLPALPTGPWGKLRVDRALTLHSMLGSTWGGFTHDESNPLPHDVVIVDEVSMVSLPMMMYLLKALRPDARLVLLGDPDQLVSIDVGSVLADLVTAELPGQPDGSTKLVAPLSYNWRSVEPIKDLAQAILRNDPDAVISLLRAGDPAIEFVEVDAARVAVDDIPQLREDVLTVGTKLHAAGLSGDSHVALEAIDEHRLLCAHAEGSYGSSTWSRQVEQFLRERVPGWGLVPGAEAPSEWFPGRPLLITQNNKDFDLFNGDTGVLMLSGGQVMAAIGNPSNMKLVSPFALDSYQTVHAMTVHKSQGSQYDRLTLILPPATSPILTRELLYTAVTRAKFKVRIIGTVDALTTAVQTPARRASGLTDRLQTVLGTEVS